MKRLVAVFSMIASTAFAGTPLDPPARYAGPIRADEWIEVYKMPVRHAREMCAMLAGKRLRFDLEGCAVAYDDGLCAVYVAERTRRARSVDALIAHEVAHCRGWAADHPQ